MGELKELRKMRELYSEELWKIPYICTRKNSITNPEGWYKDCVGKLDEGDLLGLPCRICPEYKGENECLERKS